MILIITHKGDFTADFVIDKLNKLKIKYFRFNCEDINTNNFCFSTIEESNQLFGSIENYKAIWFRRTMLPNVASELPFSERNFILQSYKSLLDNFLSITDGKWLSNHNKIEQAENKLFQLKIAKEIGFNIPKTLVTNHKEHLLKFSCQIAGDIIIKPIYSGKIEGKNDLRLLYANKLKKEHLETINNFDLTPTIFQEFIEKEIDIRVTVVGEKAFSAYIDSQNDNETKIDWRRKKRKFIKYQLPIEIEKKCIGLVRKMGLSFGAIDIVKHIDGDYFFLEINPNGQWAWIEIDTNLPISDAIIEFLND